MFKLQVSTTKITKSIKINQKTILLIKHKNFLEFLTKQ